MRSRLLGVALVLGGCLTATPALAQEDPSDDARMVYQQGPDETPVTTADDGGALVTVPTEAQAAVDLALADAALRTGLDPAAITITSLDAVDWPDSSLGCPQPGMAYSQIVRPGYRMLLDAQGTPLEYHTDLGFRAVPCDRPDAGMPASS